MKYFIMNLGCQMNQSDSERIQAVLDGMGFQKTEDESEASLRGIVACSVRQKAIDRVYTKIHEWNEIKAERNLVTFVSGCILPADEEKFLKRFDLLFHTKDLAQVPDMLKQYGVATPASLGLTPHAPKPDPLDPMGGFWNITPQYSSPFEAYIPIQNGCDKFCTFCAVPYTRGREVSRPSTDILAEVERLVASGYKSITLLGQNVNSYGLDKPGQELTFPQLLEAIGQLGERTGRDFWTYFTSPHPRDMTTDVLTTMAKYPVLAKWVHLPLQSGDDKVLIKMNRNHNMDRYREIVTNIRQILPEATLFTDIIVGFTGETEEQFLNTQAAMEEFHYQMAFIALYSPRPGAASARWDDDIPLEEKKRRFQELNIVLKRQSREWNQAQMGKTVKVLVTGPDRKPGFMAGRTEGRLPVRFKSSDVGLTGSFVHIHLTSFIPLSLEGELVEARTTAGV